MAQVGSACARTSLKPDKQVHPTHESALQAPGNLVASFEQLEPTKSRRHLEHLLAFRSPCMPMIVLAPSLIVHVLQTKMEDECMTYWALGVMATCASSSRVRTLTTIATLI